MGRNKLVYSTTSYEFLARDVCRLGDFEPGRVERRYFPDGERYLRIEDSMQGREVILLGGTLSDSDTLEIYDLGCALVKYGAVSLTLVIPYFGYSTMERMVRAGEVVTAKTRARLLSSIPQAGLGNQLYLLDLHTDGVVHYFEGSIRPVHLYGKPLIVDAISRLGGEDYVLGCTDGGRAKWVESLANELGVPAAFVFKRRIDGSRTEVTAVSAQVQGRRVIIYDDMIRTGGSLLNAAWAYQEAGASSMAAVATHGVFPGQALNWIEKSGLFDSLICTDSHPNAYALQGDFLKVESIAGLLADALG